MIRDLIRLRARLRREWMSLKAEYNKASRCPDDDLSQYLLGMMHATNADYIKVRDMVSDWQRKRNKK